MIGNGGNNTSVGGGLTPDQESEIASNTQNNHTHANSSILNGTTESYTTSLNSKLSSLESSKFLGQYTSLADLQSAHSSPAVGSYAYVDQGEGQSVCKFIWDSSDESYHEQLGSSAEETPATILEKYESNTDRNAFTDTLKSKLDAIEDTAERNVKSDWNVTNSTSDAYINNKPTIYDPRFEYLGVFNPSGSTGTYDYDLPGSGDHQIRIEQSDDPSSDDNDWCYLNYKSPDTTSRMVVCEYKFEQGSLGSEVPTHRVITANVSSTGELVLCSPQIMEENGFVYLSGSITIVVKGAINTDRWEYFLIRYDVTTGSDYLLFARKVL